MYSTHVRQKLNFMDFNRNSISHYSFYFISSPRNTRASFGVHQHIVFLGFIIFIYCMSNNIFAHTWRNVAYITELHILRFLASSWRLYNFLTLQHQKKIMTHPKMSYFLNLGENNKTNDDVSFCCFHEIFLTLAKTIICLHDQTHVS